ncbi:aldo/keto reductase [Streptomyces sp. DT203]|uniref:aldo/keto reductase n=1 Tax=Streptomyces sp. DT203 TaxID=3393424 RepID=UPI003CF30F09
MLKLCRTHGLASPPWFPPADGAPTFDVAEALAGITERHGATLGQIALARLLHRSPALCPTRGPGSSVHPAEDLGAAEIRLSAENMSRPEALAPA